jgi:hypothetical protein
MTALLSTRARGVVLGLWDQLARGAQLTPQVPLLPKVLASPTPRVSPPMVPGVAVYAAEVCPLTYQRPWHCHHG